MYFEGCWLRNQRPENVNQSNYVDKTTVRRRYIHFYDAYTIDRENGKNYLAVKTAYLYVTNTLPDNEIETYLNPILEVLDKKGYKKVKDKYCLDDYEVIINKYKNHPMNREKFPHNYSSVDIVLVTKGFDYQKEQDRMWRLSTKIFRVPEKRENPTYASGAKDILPFLPAQVEMGCGPSISAGIPPLYDMHETYRVQNHISKKFYFGKDDTLILSVLDNPEEMFKKFATVPYKCVCAEPTEGYLDFAKLYNKGIFKGIVYNNNFDRIVKRLDIPEKILRVYDLDSYIANCEFDDSVKSLISMGCHADRRQVERQARKKGLKVIFIDPEGFDENGKFISYPIEGPKTGDLIWKTTFENAMKELMKEFK